MQEAILTTEMLLVFGVILFTMVMFLSEMVRSDVVGVLVLVLIGIFNLLPSSLLFSGFSSDAVIALIAIMIIGKGLEKTGVMALLARYFARFFGDNERTLLSALMLSSGVFAGFLRTLGAIALYIPLITRLSHRTNVSKSKLLMPVAFCSIAGGSLTMIGNSPLILLNSLIDGINEHLPTEIPPLEYFSLFAVFPVGLSLVIATLIYFLVLHRFSLPNGQEEEGYGVISKKYFSDTYKVGTDLFEVKVLPNSPLINKDLQEVSILFGKENNVVAVHYAKAVTVPPLRRFIVKPNMNLAILGDKQSVEKFTEDYNLKLQSKLKVFSERLNRGQAGLAEAVIPPSSSLIGQDLRTVHMRRNHRVQVLSVIRGKKNWRGNDLKDKTLRAGDSLGMFTSWQDLAGLEGNSDFIVVTSLYPKERYKPEKIFAAVAFFILAMFLILSQKTTLPVALLIGAVGMIASRVISVDEAYSAVSWQTVFLLAGLIPLGLAMQKSGAAEWLSLHLLEVAGGLPIILMQAVVMIITSMLSLFISNVGAVVMMVPIAVTVAAAIGAKTQIFALTVAVAAANAFILPTHQGNSLITGPGKYKVKDFVQIGSGMTVIYWIVMLIVLQFL